MSQEIKRYLEAALVAVRQAGKEIRSVYRSPKLKVEAKADATPVTIADRNSESIIRDQLRSAFPDLGLFGEEHGREGDQKNRWIIDPIDGTKNFVDGLPYFATLIGLELDGEIVAGVVHAPLLGPDSGRLEALGQTWLGGPQIGASYGTGTLAVEAMATTLKVRPTQRLAEAFICHGGLKHFQTTGRWEGFTTLISESRRSRGFGDWWGHMLVASGNVDAMVDPAVRLYDLAAVKPIVEAAGGHFSAPGGEEFVDSFDSATLSATPEIAREIEAILGFR